MASIRSGIGENMEDRYLFKAKRTDNEEWVTGSLVTCEDGTCKIATRYLDDSANIAILICVYDVDRGTICQCTGLKDKNGKLIWENDVVGFWDTYSTENGQAETDCIGKVVWDDETISFQVTNRLSAESYEVLDECSVIGNVFDNAELLENEGQHGRKEL